MKNNQNYLKLNQKKINGTIIYGAGDAGKEELSINNKFGRTNIKRILIVKEPKYSLYDINILIKKIKNKIKSEKNREIINDLKFF